VVTALIVATLDLASTLPKSTTLEGVVLDRLIYQVTTHQVIESRRRLKMKRFTWLGIFIVLSLVLAACSTAADPTATPVPEEQEAPAEEPMEEAEEQMAEAKSIVDIAVEDGRFTTLVAAVQAAGLAETLSGEGQFTVFAPTDDAFAALPEGTVESLLEEPEGALKDILLYHVAEGAVPAETVVTLESATTIQGEPVAIKVMDGQVMLNDSATVIITDIEASNGIIHVIDAVILPPSIVEAAAAEQMAEVWWRRSPVKASSPYSLRLTTLLRHCLKVLSNPCSRIHKEH
jgi:uncharacterized surface protein with fasciclin (FAS1) repeats